MATGIWWLRSRFMARSTNRSCTDVAQEMYFQYAKIQPHLAGFREQMNLPEWMRNIERVVEGSAEGRSRLETMSKNLEQIAKARAAANAG